MRRALRALTLYSRQGCHLCEDFLEALSPLIRGRARVDVTDIDTDPELVATYGVRVPVLCDGETLICEAFVDARAVREHLDATD